MKPAPFDYHAPTSLAEALEILATHRDDAKALAGGQSLVPMLALRLTRFDHLIDLQRIDELVGVSQDNGSLVLGAMTTQASIGADADVARLAPLLHRATPLIGHHQIRNRGTLGGSLCHADPASEYPAVALALGAELEVVSASGTRRVPASGFCEGTWTTCLDADELLARVRIPQWHGRVGSAIDEVARRHGDFALVGAAAAVSVDDDDRVQRVGLGLFGVASTPFDAGALTQLEGRKAGELGDEQLREIGAMVAASLDPPADVHATATYRKRVAGRIVPRVLRAAIEEATNGGA
jgi:carbon-monoxide dehydrogenase medium subunit